MCKKEFYYFVYPSIAKLLNLKGAKKDIFFVIYSFYKNKKEFTGSIQFLADVINIDKRNIYPALKDLVDNNLIVKKEVYMGKTKYCKYTISDETSQVVMKHHSSSDETSLSSDDETSLGGDETSQKYDETSPNIIVQSSTLEELHTNIQTAEFANQAKIKLMSLEPIVEDVFNIYQNICTDLVPLQKYEKKKLRESIAEYLIETDKDLMYFTEVCKKANKLLKIVDTPIDLKMILRNHSGINSGKYEQAKGSCLF